MSVSYKTTTGNSILDNAYDTQLGTSPVLEVRSGAAAGPDNAAGGSLGASISCPSTAFAASSSKSKAKSGSWSASASGTDVYSARPTSFSHESSGPTPG